MASAPRGNRLRQDQAFQLVGQLAVERPAVGAIEADAG
jgi:hypothetical protein